MTLTSIHEYPWTELPVWPPFTQLYWAFGCLLVSRNIPAPVTPTVAGLLNIDLAQCINDINLRIYGCRIDVSNNLYYIVLEAEEPTVTHYYQAPISTSLMFKLSYYWTQCISQLNPEFVWGPNMTVTENILITSRLDPASVARQITNVTMGLTGEQAQAALNANMLNPQQIVFRRKAVLAEFGLTYSDSGECTGDDWLYYADNYDRGNWVPPDENERLNHTKSQESTEVISGEEPIVVTQQGDEFRISLDPTQISFDGGTF